MKSVIKSQVDEANKLFKRFSEQGLQDLLSSDYGEMVGDLCREGEFVSSDDKGYAQIIFSRDKLDRLGDEENEGELEVINSKGGELISWLEFQYERAQKLAKQQKDELNRRGQQINELRSLCQQFNDKIDQVWSLINDDAEVKARFSSLLAKEMGSSCFSVTEGSVSAVEEALSTANLLAFDEAKRVLASCQKKVGAFKEGVLKDIKLEQRKRDLIRGKVREVNNLLGKVIVLQEEGLDHVISFSELLGAVRMSLGCGAESLANIVVDNEKLSELKRGKLEDCWKQVEDLLSQVKSDLGTLVRKSSDKKAKETMQKKIDNERDGSRALFEESFSKVSRLLVEVNVAYVSASKGFPSEVEGRFRAFPWGAASI